MSPVRRANPFGEHLSAQSVLNRLLLKAVRDRASTAAVGQIWQPGVQSLAKGNR